MRMLRGKTDGNVLLHSSVCLCANLLIHLNQTTAVVNKDAILNAVVQIDAEYEVERLRLT